eukprot:m.235695 g.235695  ORF g.235695 m.235695 type:complete len:313 (+) comp12861_c0_seq1:1430-2368(+)
MTSSRGRELGLAQQPVARADRVHARRQRVAEHGRLGARLPAARGRLGLENIHHQRQHLRRWHSLAGQRKQRGNNVRVRGIRLLAGLDDPAQVVDGALVARHVADKPQRVVHFVAADLGRKPGRLLHHEVPMVPCRVVAAVVGEKLVHIVQGTVEQVIGLHNPLPMLPGMVVLRILLQHRRSQRELAAAVAAHLHDGLAVVPDLVVLGQLADDTLDVRKLLGQVLLQRAQERATILPDRVVRRVQLECVGDEFECPIRVLLPLHDRAEVVHVVLELLRISNGARGMWAIILRNWLYILPVLARRVQRLVHCSE